MGRAVTVIESKDAEKRALLSDLKRWVDGRHTAYEARDGRRLASAQEFHRAVEDSMARDLAVLGKAMDRWHGRIAVVKCDLQMFHDRFERFWHQLRDHTSLAHDDIRDLRFASGVGAVPEESAAPQEDAPSAQAEAFLDVLTGMQRFLRESQEQIAEVTAVHLETAARLREVSEELERLRAELDGRESVIAQFETEKRLREERLSARAVCRAAGFEIVAMRKDVGTEPAVRSLRVEHGTKSVFEIGESRPLLEVSSSRYRRFIGDFSASGGDQGQMLPPSNETHQQAAMAGQRSPESSPSADPPRSVRENASEAVRKPPPKPSHEVRQMKSIVFQEAVSLPPQAISLPLEAVSLPPRAVVLAHSGIHLLFAILPSGSEVETEQTVSATGLRNVGVQSVYAIDHPLPLPSPPVPPPLQTDAESSLSRTSPRIAQSLARTVGKPIDRELPKSQTVTPPSSDLGSPSGEIGRRRKPRAAPSLPPWQCHLEQPDLKSEEGEDALRLVLPGSSPRRKRRNASVQVDEIIPLPPPIESEPDQAMPVPKPNFAATYDPRLARTQGTVYETPFPRIVMASLPPSGETTPRRNLKEGHTLPRPICRSPLLLVRPMGEQRPRSPRDDLDFGLPHLF
jgi:hypothetical protein